MLQNGLNVAVFALATAVGVEYRVAAVLAGLVALVASFLLNRQSTFTSRTVEEAALDAHSLPLETAVELGLVGLLALSLLIAGAGLAARRALRERELLAGAAGATSAWLLHSAIDWHWEMPAVTLPALVMAGALIAASEYSGDAASRESS